MPREIHVSLYQISVTGSKFIRGSEMVTVGKVERRWDIGINLQEQRRREDRFDEGCGRQLDPM